MSVIIILIPCRTVVSDVIVLYFNISDEMYEHFINKNGPQFWKVWNRHFKKNVNKNVIIHGCVNDADIANKFAAHFKSVFTNSEDA